MPQPSFEQLSRTLVEAGTNADHVDSAVESVITVRDNPAEAGDDIVSRSLMVLMPNADVDNEIRSIASAAGFLTSLDHSGGTDGISPEMGARLIDSLSGAISHHRGQGNEDLLQEIESGDLSGESSNDLLVVMYERSRDASPEDRLRFEGMAQTAIATGGGAGLLPFPELSEEHLALSDNAFSKASVNDRDADDNDVVVDAIIGLNLREPDDAARSAVGRIYADAESIGISDDAGTVAVRIASDVAMQHRAAHMLLVASQDPSVMDDDPVKVAMLDAADGRPFDDGFVDVLRKEAAGEFASLPANAAIDVRSDISTGSNLPEGMAKDISEWFAETSREEDVSKETPRPDSAIKPANSMQPESMSM